MLFLLLLARRQKRPDVFGPGGKNDQKFSGQEAKTTKRFWARRQTTTRRLWARRQKRPDVFGPGGKNDQTFLGEEAKTTNVACRLVAGSMQFFLSCPVTLKQWLPMRAQPTSFSRTSVSSVVRGLNLRVQTKSSSQTAASSTCCRKWVSRCRRSRCRRSRRSMAQPSRSVASFRGTPPT